MTEFTKEDTDRVAVEIFLMRLDRPKASLMDHPEIIQLWGSNQLELIKQIDEAYKEYKVKIKNLIMAGEIK